MWHFMFNRSYQISLFVLCAMFVFAHQASARPVPQNFADLAERLLPAVVNISTTAIVKQNRNKSPQLPQFPPGSPFEDLFREL